MSGVVTSRVDPPDHLLRLVGICPWDGGWLGAFAAFGRDMSANVGRKRPGRRRPGRRGWLGTSADRTSSRRRPSGRRLGGRRR